MTEEKGFVCNEENKLNFFEELLQLSESEEPLKMVLNYVANLAQRQDEELFFNTELSRTAVRSILQKHRQKYTQERPIKCVHCGHEHLHSNGHYRDGRRRWLCLKCHRTFNDFTGTVFGYIHKINEMLKYLETDFFQGTALRIAAESLEVDKRTVFAWRHKFGTALQILLDKLPDKFLSLVDFSKEISLKGSHHNPGDRYKNPKVKYASLNKEVFVNGIISTGDDEHFSIQIVSFGKTIKDKLGERILKCYVQEKKRVVVPMKSKLAKLGQGLKRGKQRIESGVKVGGALCEKWKNLSKPRLFFNVAQCWGMKFHGVATKYLNNYYATISWIASHFHEPNWLEKLLSYLLSARNAVAKFQYLRNLKLE